MKNTYMTPLNYVNFNGIKKSTKLHFHVTPREFTDWMIDNPDKAERLNEAFSDFTTQVEENPNGEASTEQKLSMLKLVRVLAEIGYGKPSDDGEFFDKSTTDKFAYSAAYDAFRIFLFENPKELVTFLQTLLNEEVVSEFSGRMQAAEADSVAGSEPALKGITGGDALEKDPKDMSREELLEAMRRKNKNQQ